MLNLSYCESWFWANRSATPVLTEKAAKKRHEKRQHYSVAVDGFDAPTAIIEVVNDFVPVTFLDRLLRSVLTLHFEEQNPQRLLLTMATRRIFCDATEEMVEKMQAGRQNPSQPWAQYLGYLDTVKNGTTLIFKPDGSTIRRMSRHGDSSILIEPGPRYDPSHHWEDYPEFGQYDHLLKKDRHLPW